jgi:hypothetical protein
LDFHLQNGFLYFIFWLIKNQRWLAPQHKYSIGSVKNSSSLKLMKYLKANLGYQITNCKNSLTKIKAPLILSQHFHANKTNRK